MYRRGLGRGDGAATTITDAPALRGNVPDLMVPRRFGRERPPAIHGALGARQVPGVDRREEEVDELLGVAGGARA